MDSSALGRTLLLVRRIESGLLAGGELTLTTSTWDQIPLPNNRYINEMEWMLERAREGTRQVKGMNFDRAEGEGRARRRATPLSPQKRQYTAEGDTMLEVLFRFIRDSVGHGPPGDAHMFRVQMIQPYVLGMTWLVATLLATPSQALGAAPPNDDLANATIVTTLPFTHTQDGSEATVEPLELPSCSFFAPIQTIWYQFTPATAIRIEASTIGSSASTFIELYAGPLPLDLIRCNGDAVGNPLGGNLRPRIVADLLPGVNYLFRIHQFTAAGLTTTFNLATAPPPPAHDDFGQATSIAELPFTDTVNTVSATVALDDPESCFLNPGATVWYSFTPTESTTVLAHATGSDYPVSIAVMTGSPGAFVPWRCAYANVATGLAPGETYYFMIRSMCRGFTSFGCTVTPGGNLRFTLEAAVSPRAADRVFGQLAFTTGTCNTGGLSASSLCRAGEAVLDPAGNLYLADIGNNRVLRYDSPSTTDMVADRVFGQPNFQTNACNSGGLSASSLCSPLGVAIDSMGSLYVIDNGNRRLLVYDYPLAGDTIADRVVGQPDFTTASPCTQTSPLGPGTLCSPGEVVVDQAGNVYVSDFLGSRIVQFDGPISPTGDLADRVFGQPDFTTRNSCPGINATASCLGFSQGLALDATANLYVADISNSRVLVYFDPLTTDSVADFVLGQPDFASRTCNTGGPSASSLCGPRGVVVDALGNVYVSESNGPLSPGGSAQNTANQRVVVYRDPLATDAVADDVLGQVGFASTQCNNAFVSPTEYTLCRPTFLGMDGTGGLYVSDQTNSRLLWFEPDSDVDGVSNSMDACPTSAPSRGLDADGNGCTDTLDGLVAIVQGLSLASQSENGLLGKLNEARKALGRGNTNVAVNKLENFIDQVEGQRGNGISNADADLLVSYASNLIVLISGS